jgi:hypothetical protein
MKKILDGGQHFVTSSCLYRQSGFVLDYYMEMKHLTPYRQNETSLSPVRGKGMVYGGGIIKEFA